MKTRHDQAVATMRALSDRWDQLVARMQRPEHEAAVALLFRATPQALGEAAMRASKPAEEKDRQS
jgi:hypothetical protein